MCGICSKKLRYIRSGRAHPNAGKLQGAGVVLDDMSRESKGQPILCQELAEYINKKSGMSAQTELVRSRIILHLLEFGASVLGEIPGPADPYNSLTMGVLSDEVEIVRGLLDGAAKELAR